MMKKTYYLAGAAILAIIGLGVYSSQAQNANADDTDGVIVVEESRYAVVPVDSSDIAPANSSTAGKRQGTGSANTMPVGNMSNGTANGSSGANNGNPSAGSQQIQPGTAPANQPTADQAKKNQNPNYNNGYVVEEDVIETAD